MHNALDPKLMSAAERLDEVAELLALALVRLRSGKSSRLTADRGESSLDCLGHRSGHADARKRRVSA